MVPLKKHNFSPLSLTHVHKYLLCNDRICENLAENALSQNLLS